MKSSYSIEVGKWLNTMPWDLFCTFTTRYELTVKSANRLVNRLHERLNEHSDCTLFWIGEKYKLKDGCHIHALIQLESPILTNSNKKRKVFKTWHLVSGSRHETKSNFTTIAKYDPGLGGSYYVSKHIERAFTEWEMLLPKTKLR